MTSDHQRGELLIEQLQEFLLSKGFEIYGKQEYYTKKGIKLNVQIKELEAQ